ncbi:ABC transporter substrate-binding protein [Thioflexithrix psekupsensis]|uniref:ABC transporter substrate-binding protein n=1 Tax=Thioflexithrix psekupsensis TaxID=1570016 RepID=UPI00159371D8|nr:ABC transporter substrate-binding protein [Thioflexithrix psekupsensis]
MACNRNTPDAPLRIGTNFWPGYEPLYLARSLGYLTDDKVRLVENSSTSQSLRRFLEQHTEGAALTLDEVLSLYQATTDACIVLVMDISEGADVVMGKPSLQQLSDVKGVRIGVENTAVGAYMLARALQAAELSVTDVTIVPLALDQHEAGYLSGKVDAVVTFEPVRSRLLAAGAVQLFDSSQIRGEIVDVLVVRKSHLDKYPEQAHYVINNWFGALDYFASHTEDAVTRMAPRMQLPASEVVAMYEGLTLPDRDENRQLLTRAPNTSEPLRDTLHQLNRIMQEQHLLSDPVHVEQICIRGEYL